VRNRFKIKNIFTSGHLSFFCWKFRESYSLCSQPSGLMFNGPYYRLYTCKSWLHCKDSHGPDYIIQTHYGPDCRARIHMVLITEQGLALSWLQKKDAHDPYHRTKAHMVLITVPELTLGAKYQVLMNSCYWLWCKNSHVPEYGAWGLLWGTWTHRILITKKGFKGPD
jgi:hypothetical protein